MTRVERIACVYRWKLIEKKMMRTWYLQLIDLIIIVFFPLERTCNVNDHSHFFSRYFLKLYTYKYDNIQFS